MNVEHLRSTEEPCDLGGTHSQPPPGNADPPRLTPGRTGLGGPLGIDVGGEPKELAFGDGLTGQLAWRDDGRLQSTAYPSADSDDDPRSSIIDPATGQVEQVPTGEIPLYREPLENVSPGPNGEEVTCKNGGGKLTLSVTVDGHVRTLLSAGAPSTYCMRSPAWNHDRSWFVVKDDLDRLLLVATANPSATRLLVDGPPGHHHSPLKSEEPVRRFGSERGSVGGWGSACA